LRLEKALLSNPREGKPLGQGAYTIRLETASKGRGKRGGARVISLLETTIIGEVGVVKEGIVV